MSHSSVFKIQEEPNVYHDNTLDILGAGFNFSHEKGLAEWLKNSVDAYRRAGISDKDQNIIFRFLDGGTSTSAIIECIDFVGMEYEDIDKALKMWGDPEAAKRGLKIKVYGGHGNGGKFYMRQMFQQSYYITFRNGKINIFGFNEKQKYGFVEEYKDKVVSLDEALDIANIDKSLIPHPVLLSLMAGVTGFTVVKGIRPKKLVGYILPVSKICEKLKYHPQARSPLKFINVSVIHNDKTIMQNLKMEEIEPLIGFEKPFIFEIPEFLDSALDGENSKKVMMSNKKYTRGELVLKTSSVPFGHSGKKVELNCIDIIGEIGVIASYSMQQIGWLRYYPQAQYIYGECKCPILEDSEYDCVQNDREKLVTNEKTDALLLWISKRIDEVGGSIHKKEAEKEEEKNVKVTDEFNQILNKWKNQFMSKLFADVLGGSGNGDSTGGQGDEGSNAGKNNDSKSKGGSSSNSGGGKGNETKKGPRMPLVLLSGQEDPEYPGEPVIFSERHFAVEQRQQDVSRGIYWINRDKPMAKKIIEKYSVDSPRWRSYLFQRYVDIFTKETIYRVAKKEGGVLTPEQIDQEIMRVASLVYDKASVDLEAFLLDDKFTDKNK